MNFCPTCNAASVNTAPHGDGNPCPTALELHAATVDERNAHTMLMEAQTAATIASNSTTGRRLRSQP